MFTSLYIYEENGNGNNVEQLETAYFNLLKAESESELLYDWRFTANQFVLERSPLRFTIRDLFLQLNPGGYSPYVASSLKRGWVCILRIGFAFVKCMYHMYSMLSKILPCALSSVNPRFAKEIVSILLISCYNSSLVTWTVVSLIVTKFNPLIFSTSGFALSYAHNTFILMILYGFCLLPAQFFIQSYTYGRLKVVCKSRTGVHLGKFPMVRRTLVCRRCNFKNYMSGADSQAGPA
jgi:hypothetical protein